MRRKNLFYLKNKTSKNMMNFTTTKTTNSQVIVGRAYDKDGKIIYLLVKDGSRVIKKHVNHNTPYKY